MNFFILFYFLFLVCMVLLLYSASTCIFKVRSKDLLDSSSVYIFYWSIELGLSIPYIVNERVDYWTLVAEDWEEFPGNLPKLSCFTLQFNLSFLYSMSYPVKTNKTNISKQKTTTKPSNKQRKNKHRQTKNTGKTPHQSSFSAW